MMGRRQTLMVFTSDTISRGKQLYGDGNAQWKADGEILKDDRKFGDYGIEDGDTIVSNDRTRGGN